MPNAKAKTIKVTKRITIQEDPETRTILVGLHVNGDGGDQRVLALSEPSMVAFRDLQKAANEADDGLPDVATPADPKNPTGAEVDERSEQIRAQQTYCYAEPQPYGGVFRRIVEVCSGEEVKDEEVPTWALNPDAMRRILGFFKAPLPGPDAAALLAAIQTQAESS